MGCWPIRFIFPAVAVSAIVNLVACMAWPGLTGLAVVKPDSSQEVSPALLLLGGAGAGTGATTLPCGGQCFIFVTSMSYPGGLGGISGADAFCASEKTSLYPSAPGLASDYKALLMDSAGNRNKAANWVLYANTSYFSLSNGNLLVATTTATAEFPAAVTNTVASSSNYPWTGIAPGGPPYAPATSAYTCNNWTDSTTGFSGYYANSFISAPIYNGTASYLCNNPRSLYCVQQ